MKRRALLLLSAEAAYEMSLPFREMEEAAERAGGKK
jgi:hypothetical protein